MLTCSMMRFLTFTAGPVCLCGVSSPVGNTKRAFTKWSKQPRAFPVTAIAKLISLPRYTTRYSRQWRTDITRDVNNMGPL